MAHLVGPFLFPSFLKKNTKKKMVCKRKSNGVYKVENLYIFSLFIYCM